MRFLHSYECLVSSFERLDYAAKPLFELAQGVIAVARSTTGKQLAPLACEASDDASRGHGNDYHSYGFLALQFFGRGSSVPASSVCIFRIRANIFSHTSAFHLSSARPLCLAKSNWLLTLLSRSSPLSNAFISSISSFAVSMKLRRFSQSMWILQGLPFCLYQVLIHSVMPPGLSINSIP